MVDDPTGSSLLEDIAELAQESKGLTTYGLTNIAHKDGGEHVYDRMVPVNPYCSASGIRGRGTLPLWGPNYMHILFAWYWNTRSNQAEVILMRDPNLPDRIFSLPKGVPHFIDEKELIAEWRNGVIAADTISPQVRELWIEDMLRTGRGSTGHGEGLERNGIEGVLNRAISEESRWSANAAGYVIHPLNTENAWVEAIVHYRCIDGFEHILASPVPTGGNWDDSYFTLFPVIDCAIALSSVDRRVTLKGIVDGFVCRPRHVYSQ